MSNNRRTTSEEDPPVYNHRTTTSILHHAATLTLTLLPTTLTLTLLLFSFNSFLDHSSLFLSSFLDRHPSLPSLLSHLPSDHLSPSSSRSRPRHRSFLHLTRVGTFDDDLFTSDEYDYDVRTRSRPPNSSSVTVSLVSSSVVRPGITFQLPAVEEEEEKNEEEVVDLRFFIPVLELGRREATSLVVLIAVLSAVYGWVILAFVITYSWASGIVFVAVVNNLLGRYKSLLEIVWSGSGLGFKRLSGFISMRWAVRDALTQILGLWFFGEVTDQYSFFKFFLRLKLMPFSIASPWVAGYDEDVSGFLLTWFLVDTVVSFVFAVDSWVTIVSTRRGGREIVKEGCYLLATMIHQSVQLKCLELIMCGAFVRWVLARLFGKSFAVLLQSLMEVYFMVAWLIFYFAVRYRDARLSGRRFGRRELESLVEGLR